MTSAMMMERTGMGLPGMGMPGMASPQLGSQTGLPSPANWMMVPRCTLKMEKCTGGLRVSCVCDDRMATSMVQNLCSMLSNGMFSCCCMLNGMTVCACNLTMGMCKCEMTEDGVSITCTSGDAKRAEMLQAACDCLSCMMEAGCTCCLLMNSTPICCGCGEHGKAGNSKGKNAR